MPALCRCIVAGTSIDPALAARCLLLLPEWRLSFQIVHDELTRSEGLAPMSACDGDEHDLIGGMQSSDTMDDTHIHDVPTLLGLRDDVRQRLLRHAGVVLERELRHDRAIVDIAHQSDETGDRPDRAAAPVTPAPQRDEPSHRRGARGAGRRCGMAATVEIGGLTACVLVTAPAPGGRGASSPPRRAACSRSPC